MNRKSLGIYIHIPFCVQKCLYCDFVSAPACEKEKIDYVNFLLKEIENKKEMIFGFHKQGVTESSENGMDDALDNQGFDVVDSIFIGGGTPSTLPGECVQAILCKLKENFRIVKNCECSIEVNPGTVDKKKLLQYKEAGVNRLSIGLQSCNFHELKALGRIHDYQDFEKTFQAAREVGFENINVDLMSAIPNQTVESFVASLRKVAELAPEHISVYSLIVEEGTPFYDMDLNLPTEDQEREMYAKTGEILKAYGYGQYEISNYAKPGKECRHNIRYWQCEEYLGFGVAAASYYAGVRWKNLEMRQEYENVISSFIKENKTGQEMTDFYAGDIWKEYFSEWEELTEEDRYTEFMFMGLRMNSGVSKKEFRKRFGRNMDEVYGPVLEKHIQNGLLKCLEDRIVLTERGRDVCNVVMADFLFEP